MEKEKNMTPAEVHLTALTIEMEKFGQDYFAEHAEYILKLLAVEQEKKVNETREVICND